MAEMVERGVWTGKGKIMSEARMITMDNSHAKDWQLSLVRGLGRRRDSAEAAIKVHVGYARHYGAKWGEIAKALRMDKGEVKRKYGAGSIVGGWGGSNAAPAASVPQPEPPEWVRITDEVFGLVAAAHKPGDVVKPDRWDRDGSGPYPFIAGTAALRREWEPAVPPAPEPEPEDTP